MTGRSHLGDTADPEHVGQAAPGAPPPSEFGAEAVCRASPPEAWLFRDFHARGEPEASLRRSGLTFRKDLDSPTHLSDGEGHYYNTGGASARFWEGRGLPQPTRDLALLRRDLAKWGFCLISEALSSAQLAAMRQRVVDQAAGERAAGVALWLNASAGGSNAQFVTTLLNKGLCFEGALEFDPAAVQAGPLMEQLLREALGGDFLVNSFQGIIAHENGYPQALHQDNNGSPFQTPDAPPMVTAMYMLDDVGPANGGTLVVPGSHALVSQTPAGEPVADLPPAINVTAPAGSVMLFDARLLHGTGVNRTSAPRHVLIAGFLRTFMRTQEVWHLSAAPAALRRASPRLLQRLGFAAHTIGTVEGHGLGASGGPEDEFSSILEFRLAVDRGGYERIGELSAGSCEALLMRPYTYRTTASGRRSLGKADKFGLLEGERLGRATALSYPEGRGEGGGYARRGTGSNSLGSKL